MILQPKPGIDLLELVNVVCYQCSFPGGDYTTYSLNKPYLLKSSFERSPNENKTLLTRHEKTRPAISTSCTL